jgi:predicted kinase
MTQGRRQLLKVLERTTARHVALRCQVAPSTVRNWLAGYNNPGPTRRLLLYQMYGIKPESWNTYIR